MGTERWTWRSSAASTTGPSAPRQYAPLKGDLLEPLEGRKPRTLAGALRSLSNCSLDSMTSLPSRTGSSARKLQKTTSGSESMIERLQRRVSKDSFSSTSPSECPGSPMECPFASMEVMRCGWLKTDVSLLKARSEYLVLTDYSLVKFGSAEAAKSVLPQLSLSESPARGSSSPRSISSKSATMDPRLEVPLLSVVAAFIEESSAYRFGIEVWWFSQPPTLAYCKTHFFFALPKERDDWLAAIQQAHKARLRKNPVKSSVPANLKIRINHAIQATETYADGVFQSPIFPVAGHIAGATHKGTAADNFQDLVDVSSFYLAVGPCLCYFIEVLRADYLTLPGELRLKINTFGTVTLTRFRASVASHEQRFAANFRFPFGRETRLDLASTYYRRIIEVLTKVDRILKPMWPQHLQQSIFQIKGLPPQLQLTSGNDLGGLETSLRAYCAAFHVQIPAWKIEWNTPSQPAFRLLPSDGIGYAPLQLLAVFRALRYNSFFKAISFRDVDLSPLIGKDEYSKYGDSVVHTSLSGMRVPEDRYELLLQAPILEQEIHALLFASESIRAIDFTNVVGLQNLSRAQPSRGSTNHSGMCKMTSEIIRPVVTILKEQLCLCHSVSMSGNPVAPSDVDELANLLGLDGVYIRKLELANCMLPDVSLTKLWTGLAQQAATLEWLDTSANHGTVSFGVVHHTLGQLRNVKKLNISGNTRLDSEEQSLFKESAINSWSLQELDLSGIKLNDATVRSIGDYMESKISQSLQVVRLNNSGLTGSQIARLFQSLGQARQLTVHVNANQLDEGIDDLCRAIATGYGPWSLFIQMIEFKHEASYIKLLRALTVNKTIECLSLAGCATPDALSNIACQTATDFFAKNDTVRFLDISGYDSKLDEGRLGQEFSKSLSGMRFNRRIEHLRVRSQMLNINMGYLAEAIESNKTLHTLDCEGNNFSLSNFWHLVRHIGSNTTIRHFSAFSQQDLAIMMQKSIENDVPVAPPRGSSGIFKLKHGKSQASSENSLVQRLRDEWDSAVGALQQVLERNQMVYEARHRSENIAAENIHRKVGAEENSVSNDFGDVTRREYKPRKAISSPLSTSLLSNARPKKLGALMHSQATSGEYSIASSGATSSPTSNESASSDPHESGLQTRSAMEAAPENAVVRGSFPDGELLYDEARHSRYLFSEGHDDGGAGLQMGRYRRFLGDPTSRIEEEDDKTEGERKLAQCSGP